MIEYLILGALFGAIFMSGFVLGQISGYEKGKKPWKELYDFSCYIYSLQSSYCKQLEERIKAHDEEGEEWKRGYQH